MMVMSKVRIRMFLILDKLPKLSLPMIFIVLLEHKLHLLLFFINS